MFCCFNITEDVIREFSVVSFQVEGKGSITDADGNEIGSQVEVENKKSLEFYVNPEDGYEVAEVIIDGTVISRSDNKYAVSPSKDVEIKVTFAEKEEEEEYVETIDTVEVNGVTIKVTTYSEGVLPKGYKVVAEEVSAGTVPCLLYTSKWKKKLRLICIIGVLSAAVLALLLIIGNTAGIWEKWFGITFHNQYLLFDNKWGSDRGFTWKAAAGMFAEMTPLRKLFGAGPDCFKAYSYSIPEYADLLYQYWKPNILTNAHNEFLNLLICIGIVGLLAFLAMLGRCV